LKGDYKRNRSGREGEEKCEQLNREYLYPGPYPCHACKEIPHVFVVTETCAGIVTWLATASVSVEIETCAGNAITCAQATVSIAVLMVEIETCATETVICERETETCAATETESD
jgi:hypothetical protein